MKKIDYSKINNDELEEIRRKVNEEIEKRLATDPCQFLILAVVCNYIRGKKEMNKIEKRIVENYENKLTEIHNFYKKNRP